MIVGREPVQHVVPAQRSIQQISSGDARRISVRIERSWSWDRQQLRSLLRDCCSFGSGSAMRGNLRSAVELYLLPAGLA